HREDGAPSYLHERNVVGDQLPSRRTQTVTRSLLYRKGGWPTYFPLGVYPSRWRGCPIDFALFAKWVGRWHPSHRALTTTSSCFRSRVSGRSLPSISVSIQPAYYPRCWRSHWDQKLKRRNRRQRMRPRPWLRVARRPVLPRGGL